MPDDDTARELTRMPGCLNQNELSALLSHGDDAENGFAVVDGSGGKEHKAAGSKSGTPVETDSSKDSGGKAGKGRNAVAEGCPHAHRSHRHQ
eukprot:gene3334-14863_t